MFSSRPVKDKTVSLCKQQIHKTGVAMKTKESYVIHLASNQSTSILYYLRLSVPQDKQNNVNIWIEQEDEL
jgi:hypothetical protein